ncbi:MAG: hypothetical protein D6689_01175 [Deltaproteobacteria bacterium]|nr:MAG: hypothetical protein D6689_01175 [Deltaproteobacteria bacterium]
MTARIATIATAVLALGAACGGATGDRAPAPFRTDWPASARPYDRVVREWTRSGHLVADFDKVLDVSATFLSPDWRAAYVDFTARRERLSADARARLAAAQRRADAEAYEVELFVATYRHEENDLQRGAKSTWRVVLVDAEGREIAPTEIRRDRRPFEVLRTIFPHARPHQVAYVARFPRAVDLLSGRQFSLRIGSARGTVELVWTAAR